jgi:hypothetical protein
MFINLWATRRGPRMRGLVTALLLALPCCGALTYSKTDVRHWPTGVRTTNLAPHIASVTNCLDNPTTSSACGRLAPGRTSTSADWCTRADQYNNGTLKLHEVLKGTAIDVVIVPAADDTEWQEGSPGNIVGFVGAVLQDIASRGGFQIHAYIIRGVSSSDPTDTYGGAWTGLLADWAPRGDMVANWWTDVASRRTLGVQYLSSFYQLDITLVSRLNPPDSGGSSDDSIWTFENTFAFLTPFEYSTWGLIVVAMICVGLLERYIEGHFESGRLLNPHSVIARLRDRQDQRNASATEVETHGNITIKLKWTPENESDQEGAGVLTVDVVKANNLDAADKNGFSDPYAIVEYGLRRVKTAVIKKNLNPVWNSSFEFVCASLEECIADPLKVRVFDYDGLVGGADLLGNADFDLGFLRRDGPADVVLDASGGKDDSIELVQDLLVPPPDVDRLTKIFVPILKTYRNLLRLAEWLYGTMICGLAFIEGGGYRVESTTLSGRLLTFAWCYASMIFLSSYTASLASFLVSQNTGPVGYLSTTGYEDLIQNRFPVCVRSGSAPSALLAQYLGEGYPIIFEGGDSIEAIQVKMAERLRNDECKAVAVTFWDVGKFLVSDANLPCDLRQLPAGPVTQIPARGGYTAAGPIMKQRWLTEHYGANISDLGTDAYGRTPYEAAQCTFLPTASLGMLIREFEGRGGEYPIKGARAIQLGKSKTSTCQDDGSPAPARAEDAGTTSSRIKPEGFLGLWLVLAGSMVVAFISAPPTLKGISTLKLGFYEKFFPHRQTPKRTMQVTKLDALREALRPPPTVESWREHVDVKLDRIKDQLDAQAAKLATGVATERSATRRAASPEHETGYMGGESIFVEAMLKHTLPTQSPQVDVELNTVQGSSIAAKKSGGLPQRPKTQAAKPKVKGDGDD